MEGPGCPLAPDRERTSPLRGGFAARAAALSPVVLIVDDYPDALDLLEITLALAGYATVRASNGAEAVDLARAYRPAAIIMDLFLPRLDGSEAAHAIRQIPGLEAVPIVGHTARCGRLEDDGAVFDRVLRKPCSPDVLLATVSELLRTPIDETANLRT
jgi:CheY-like chemotaxis protein